MHHCFLPDFINVSKVLPLVRELFNIYHLPSRESQNSLSKLIADMEKRVNFDKLWLSGLNEKILSIDSHKKKYAQSSSSPTIVSNVSLSSTPPNVLPASSTLQTQPEEAVRAEEISRNNIPVPGRLIVTNLSIYFQYFNNIEPKAYVKYEHKHIRNIIKRRYLLRQVSNFFLVFC
jgi:hypothetical protein